MCKKQRSTLLVLFGESCVLQRQDSNRKKTKRRRKKKKRQKKNSNETFRSSDLRVMGPARFHCATLLKNRGGCARFLFRPTCPVPQVRPRGRKPRMRTTRSRVASNCPGRSRTGASIELLGEVQQSRIIGGDCATAHSTPRRVPKMRPRGITDRCRSSQMFSRAPTGSGQAKQRSATLPAMNGGDHSSLDSTKCTLTV